jgi:hypothetical protein
MVSFRFALSTFLAAIVLASCSFPVLAQRSDPTAVANDPAAFARARATFRARTDAQEAARRPVHLAKHQADGGCRIKPVMTDAEIDACRRVKR